jgi:hypothetical protein
MSLTKKQIEVKPDMFKTIYVEEGTKLWDAKDGDKREQILDRVGPEYKQINYLAAIVAEVLKAQPTLLENPVIADALAKFNEIEDIRNS